MGLGSCDCVYRSLNKLIERGEVKLNLTPFDKVGNPPNRYGILCVDGMKVSFKRRDPETGEIFMEMKPLFATHYKDAKTGKILPI